MAAIKKEELEKVEAFLKGIMLQYWTALQKDAQMLGRVLLKEVSEFLRKVGKNWTKSLNDTATFNKDLKPFFYHWRRHFANILKKLGPFWENQSCQYNRRT